MTQDEIKKIAEEYLDKTYPKYRELNPYSVKNKIAEIVEVIEYLIHHYFIVEKSKVREAMSSIGTDGSLIRNREVIYMLSKLFGTDAFKEE